MFSEGERAREVAARERAARAETIEDTHRARERSQRMRATAERDREIAEREREIARRAAADRRKG